MTMDNPNLPSEQNERAERKFAELQDLLTVACGLIEIEARDHETNHRADPAARKRIAITLNAFAQRARSAIKQTGAA